MMSTRLTCATPRLGNRLRITMPPKMNGITNMMSVSLAMIVSVQPP